MPPIINQKKCSRCGTCVSICPMNILEKNDNKKIEVVYLEECWYCNSCVFDCPSHAISLRIPFKHDGSNR